MSTEPARAMPPASAPTASPGSPPPPPSSEQWARVAAGVRRIARSVPAPARARVKDAVNRLHAAYAKQRWHRARPTPEPLSISALPAFERRFPVQSDGYGYAPDELLRRGVARRGCMEPFVPVGARTLEIGSADGMTSAELARTGRRATAIDLDVSRTDPRVRAAGVTVLEMDATRLTFPDATFDLVFSFNVFEHLSDPAATFAELVRVLRPGGVAWLSFTALRWSPHGAHMYKVIGVPYVTVLFDEAALLASLAARGVSGFFPWVNEYSIERFREVFRGHGEALETLHYAETWNRWHVGLIAEFPGLFKARAPSFDSLLVDSVQARFRRRGQP